MRLFTNAINDKRMRVRYDQLLNSYTVTLDHTDILFKGPKAQCLDFVEGFLDQFLMSRR